MLESLRQRIEVLERELKALVRPCVVFVHGVGEQDASPPEAFFERIRRAYARELARQGRPAPAEGLLCEYVYWADVTQPDQNALQARLAMRGWLRDFLVNRMGDAIAYSKLPYPPDKYGEIQARFADALRRVSQAVAQGGEPQGSLTVIAHSLGSVIASDGLYEHLKSGAFPANLRLAHVVTLGSPIALYGLRYGLDRFTKPIRPAVWLNLYFPQDLIGFPLKALNEAYADAVTEDFGLRPGGGMSPWSGLLRWLLGQIPVVNALWSHGWYFTDRRVIRRIAALLTSPEKGVERGRDSATIMAQRGSSDG